MTTTTEQDYPSIAHLVAPLVPDAERTPNLEAMAVVRDYIAGHPEEWYQSGWRCSSGMCFAGHGAQMAGGRWLSAADKGHVASLLVPEPTEVEADLAFEDRIHVSERAERIFGLNAFQAAALFSAENDLLAIDMVIADIAAGEEDPDYAYDLGTPEQAIAAGASAKSAYVAGVRERRARREAFAAAHPETDYAAARARQDAA